MILLILKSRNFTSLKAVSTHFFPQSFTCWEDKRWFGRHKMMLRVSPVPLKLNIITVLFLSHFFPPKYYLFSLTAEVFKQSLTVWLYELELKNEVMGSNYFCTYTVPFLQCHSHPFITTHTSQDCFIWYWNRFKKSTSTSSSTPCLIWNF